MSTPTKDYNLGDLDFFAEDSDIAITERDSDITVVREVPANMVALAQKSWDEHKRLTLSFRGKSNEMITDFVETMKFAGDHTTPLTTVMVKREPEDSVVVEMWATNRRGRKPGSTDSSDKPANETQNGKAGESLPKA